MASTCLGWDVRDPRPCTHARRLAARSVWCHAVWGAANATSSGDRCAQPHPALSAARGGAGAGAVGTHKAKGPEVVQAVRWALQAGYRHIGTTPPRRCAGCSWR